MWDNKEHFSLVTISVPASRLLPGIPALTTPRDGLKAVRLNQPFPPQVALTTAVESKLRHPFLIQLICAYKMGLVTVLDTTSFSLGISALTCSFLTPNWNPVNQVSSFLTSSTIYIELDYNTTYSLPVSYAHTGNGRWTRSKPSLSKAQDEIPCKHEVCSGLLKLTFFRCMSLTGF